jgi:hypothetical protein
MYNQMKQVNKQSKEGQGGRSAGRTSSMMLAFLDKFSQGCADKQVLRVPHLHAPSAVIHEGQLAVGQLVRGEEALVDTAPRVVAEERQGGGLPAAHNVTIAESNDSARARRTHSDFEWNGPGSWGGGCHVAQLRLQEHLA